MGKPYDTELEQIKTTISAKLRSSVCVVQELTYHEFSINDIGCTNCPLSIGEHDALACYGMLIGVK